MPKRLLIVDKHPLTRWALTRMVADHDDLQVVGETGLAAQATQLVASLQPDVVTTGISLLDGDGLRLARDLRDRYPALGIVILTARGEDDVLFRALETGVSAFVSKHAGIAEILGAIRHAIVAANAFSAAGLSQALRRRQATQQRLVLSPRERQVLAMLEQGQSVPTVAATLYVSVSTAKTYVARIYDKLGATNRAQALMAAVRLGLIEHEILAG